MSAIEVNFSSVDVAIERVLPLGILLFRVNGVRERGHHALKEVDCSPGENDSVVCGCNEGTQH